METSGTMQLWPREVRFPRLYAILDRQAISQRDLDLFAVATAWRDAGIALVQYRDKWSAPEVVLRNTIRLREIFQDSTTLLLLNDYPELAQKAGLSAVHIGQTDGSMEEAHEHVPLVGVSTHNDTQVAAAEKTSCFYVAIGPVYPTSSKLDTDPQVGLEGVRRARQLTTKPLVAIGGIHVERAPEVLEAGADSVAVISGLLEGNLFQCARTFLDAVH